MTTYTSASEVILRWCLGSLETIRQNLATVEPRDWMEEDMMALAVEHLNELNKAVRGMADHRKTGARAQ